MGQRVVLRLPAAIALAALAACAPIAAVPPADDDTFPPPLEACGADRFQDYVGREEAALDRTRLPEGARVIHPGTAVTTDFVPERLNVEVGEDGRITRIYCG